MKKKSLGLNAFLNGLRSVLNIIFPVITFPYVSRILGVGEIGKYNFSNSFIQYFILIAGLGIATYAVREGAKFRGDRQKLNYFASQVFSINILSTVVSYAILFLCLLFFNKLHAYLASILIFSIQIIFTTLGTEWIYTIFEEYTYITVRSIVFKIISIIALFIFVRHQGDYLNYAAITVFSAVGSNILNYLHAKKFCSIRLTFQIEWSKHMKPIMVIFASTVATTIYLSLDITLLGLMKNDYVVGIYSVSTKMYNIVKNLIAAVLTVTIPRFALLWGKKRVREFRKLLLQISDMLALLSIPTAVGVFMLAPQIVLLLSSQKYMRAVTSLRLLCPALVFSIFSWIFASCVLIPAKRESKVLLITIISALLNLILNIILIPHFAETAAAIITSLSEFVSMVMDIYFSRDIIKGVYSKGFFKNIVVYILGSTAVAFVCVAGNLLFKSTIAIIAFDVIASVLEYGLILIGTQNNNIMQAIDMLALKFRR
ncbi:flippase [Lactobacillus delbrueckii]|uniref:flippase n=1 Tax=Lactobacillus delbrueckii TaxID=1584 RepID=UPI0007395F80|nr:flippase [Lactobacillus delbrueckii]CUS16847.1 Membrane protein involved in the export of O-antigen and teichoic acid [Lactobacillus delbrueckii subsp. bulgaricus]